MFNTPGERVTYCRGLLGYTRSMLVSEIPGISLSTISRWELGYNEIPETKFDKLVSFFNDKGISVHSNWIKNGTGMPPINTNLNDISNNNFDEISYLTLSNLKQQIKDFEFKQITTNFFNPIFSYGDYAGGVVKENLKLLDNKLCFVISQTDVDVGIFLFNELCIKNFNNEKKYYNNTNIITGEIIWTAKRS